MVCLEGFNKTCSVDIPRGRLIDLSTNSKLRAHRTCFSCRRHPPPKCPLPSLPITTQIISSSPTARQANRVPYQSTTICTCFRFKILLPIQILPPIQILLPIQIPISSRDQRPTAPTSACAAKPHTTSHPSRSTPR